MNNDLVVFSKDVIPVYMTDTGEKVVIGRELHKALGIGKDYSTWFKDMCSYGFTDGKSYSPISVNRSDGLPGKPRTDHIMTLDMAKHIAIIQRSDIGFSVRDKLIQLETDVSTLSPELQLLIKLEVNQKKQAAQIELTNKRIDDLSQILQLNSKNWREDSVKIMKRIGYVTGNYKQAWADVYTEVERRGGFNLKTRLAHAQDNARKSGMPESMIGKMKNLHVIEMDKRLIEIYLAIVKEYAVCNGVTASDIE